MPYLINAPTNPRSYITNNPVIYMDARSWGWPTESLPYRDDYAKSVRDEERARGEYEWRDRQLEELWEEEREKRREGEELRRAVEGVRAKGCESDATATDDDVSCDGDAHELRDARARRPAQGTRG